jgi:enoyl-CoA hydratase/carnithine racemase
MFGSDFDGDALTTVRYDVADGVATVTLDRPDQHNAFTAVMADELSGIWRHVRSADDVRCVVLTAAGDRSFCTGIDRAEIPSDGAPFDALTYDDPGQLLGPRSNQCWKPVIAAVNGMACGGAFYLLGESDFIIAADHATFFDPHVTFGMAAVYEPTLMLPRMPFGELARLTLLGAHERMSARRAFEIGLVSEVVPAADLLTTATGVAREIASQPPVAVQTSVRTLWAARELSRQQMLGVSNAFLAIGTTPDALAAGQVVFNSGTRITPRVR